MQSKPDPRLFLEDVQRKMIEAARANEGVAPWSPRYRHVEAPPCVVCGARARFIEGDAAWCLDHTDVRELFRAFCSAMRERDEARKVAQDAFSHCRQWFWHTSVDSWEKEWPWLKEGQEP